MIKQSMQGLYEGSDLKPAPKQMLREHKALNNKKLRDILIDVP